MDNLFIFVVSRVISLDFFQMRPGLPVERDDYVTRKTCGPRYGGVMSGDLRNSVLRHFFEMSVVLVYAQVCTAPVAWGEFSHERIMAFPFYSSRLKIRKRDTASPATQGVCARPKAAAHTGCGISCFLHGEMCSEKAKVFRRHLPVALKSHC